MFTKGLAPVKIAQKKSTGRIPLSRPAISRYILPIILKLCMHSHPLFSVIVALHLKHFVICALFGHQLLVGAHLGDLAAGHKQKSGRKNGVEDSRWEIKKESLPSVSSLYFKYS